MALRKFGPVVGQEMMYFDGPVTIETQRYDRKEAQAAALRRVKRKGELALRQQTEDGKIVDRTKGFRHASNNLWAPHSKTENNAVIDGSLLFRHKQYSLIEDIILNKYAGDEYDISPARVAVWARFGGTRASRAAAGKFDDWRHDAWSKFNAMQLGIGSRGEIRRTYAMGSSLVLNGIKTYLADLKSFIGHEDMLTETGKRQWMQPRWTSRQAAHDRWTDNYMYNLQDLDFEELTAEAYYNHRSRYQYWSDVMARDEELRHDVQVHRYFEELENYIEGRE